VTTKPVLAEHATIQIERVYPHPVSAVFACWSDAEARRKWEPTPEGMVMAYEGDDYDFKVGFIERSRMLQGDQELARFESRFVDIVPDSRIISVVCVSANDTLMSSSQHTLEFFSEEGKTRIKCTEQVAWLHGQAMQTEHEDGWNVLLDRLGEVLDGKR
jgi:uncharacterized protein YndB with AHSA1/START domain